MEGLSSEDANHNLHNIGTPYTYVAMIVTTASFKPCEYDENVAARHDEPDVARTR